VADDRTTRFLNLERTRKEGPAAKGASGAPSRFDAVEQRAEVAALPSASGAATERFREPAQVLELAREDERDQPFIRCARCEADSHAQATCCQHCGSDLGSSEQRSFNERLWRKHLEERSCEAVELERLRRAREDAEAEEGARRSDLAASLAREVATATRRRLDAEERGAFTSGLWRGNRYDRWDPIASLLARAPAVVRLGLFAGAVATAGALLAVPRTRPFGLMAAVVFGIVAVRLLLR
jgi:hypothetical protein